MPSPLACSLALLPLALLFAPPAPAAEPLHQRIDQLIAAKAKGRPVSPRADDAEFLRRVTLDFHGTIPTSAQARAFLADTSADKRARLIDRLLASPEYPRRMAELFHVVLMERMGDHPEWAKYLRKSFEANKPWDQMAREILRASPRDEATRGAAFFYAKRLANYGQNPVDHAALTRDVGRLFLGKDFRCAQCHDHLFIKDYKQHDFQGLLAFFQNAYLLDAAFPAVAERPLPGKLPFMSVFKKVPRATGPRVPGKLELTVPIVAKGNEYLEKPDRKTRSPGVLRFSPLGELAKQLPVAENADFTRNIANRLWWVMMGRGLVHPLDLHHGANPPSHPELLDLLARELIANKFDLKWLMRELALTETYQRSSILPEGAHRKDGSLFTTALERRLSAEQLLWATLEATGERERLLKAPPGKGKKGADTLDVLRTKFVRAFANPPREAEDEHSPSLKGALFLLNDEALLGTLVARPGNLMDRLGKLGPDKVAEELYLSVLTRRPDAEELAEVAKALAGKTGQARTGALARLAWALLASTEFSVNH